MHDEAEEQETVTSLLADLNFESVVLSLFLVSLRFTLLFFVVPEFGFFCNVVEVEGATLDVVVVVGA